MKQILKALRSIEFWLAAITLIVGTIAAWPTIEKMMVNDPVVYFGDGIRIEANNLITIDYLLPFNRKSQKAVVPFPVVFANENGVPLEKFFIIAKSKAKKTTDGGWMPRLVAFSDYFAKSDRKDGLLSNESTNYNNGIQTIGNPDSGIDFASKTIYENVMALNLAGNGNTEVWDECSLTLTVGASNCNTKEYKFSVRCYFVNDLKAKSEELMVSKNERGQYFLIVPTYSFTRINQDSLSIPMFEMGEESIIKQK